MAGGISCALPACTAFAAFANSLSRYGTPRKPQTCSSTRRGSVAMSSMKIVRNLSSAIEVPPAGDDRGIVGAPVLVGIGGELRELGDVGDVLTLRDHADMRPAPLDRVAQRQDDPHLRRQREDVADAVVHGSVA